MSTKPSNNSAHGSTLRISPTRSGRRRVLSEKAVKRRWQSPRPVVLRVICSWIGVTGLLYIEGRLSSEAAILTPAEILCSHLSGRRLPQSEVGQGHMAIHCGVITKHNHNKIETDLSWVLAYNSYTLLHKAF